MRHPDTVAKAEKLATDWLSMIERVRHVLLELISLKTYCHSRRKIVNRRCCAVIAMMTVPVTKSSIGKHEALV